MLDWLKRQKCELVAPLKPKIHDPKMFNSIVGYDDYKEFFYQAIISEYKLNLLLHGAKGTGKSEFLKEIERKYKNRCIYIDCAATTTKAGLRDILFQRGSQTKFLLVDEINLMEPRDLSIFLSLCQDNAITVTMNKTYKKLQLYNLKIFATCNYIPDNKKLKAAINDRFDRYDFYPYNYEELSQISQFCLKNKVKNKELINYIVDRVYYDLKSTSVRDIIDIAHYQFKDFAQIDRYIDAKLRKDRNYN